MLTKSWSKIQVKTVKLWNIITNNFTIFIFYNTIYLLDGQEGFLASQDPSEIILKCWFGAQETLLSMLRTVVLPNIFCGNVFFF